MDDSIGPVVFVVERDEVVSEETTRIQNLLVSLLATPERAKSHFQQIDLAFSGYDEDPRELYEIEPVRAFVHRLDGQFPYWLYFMDLSLGGLYAVAMCFLPPFLTEEGKAEVHPSRLGDLLRRRWIPALNDLAVRTGMAEAELRLVTSRCLDYFFKGKQLPPIVN